MPTITIQELHHIAAREREHLQQHDTLGDHTEEQDT